jgi:NAD(P)-dependent dehydrogenase (short-subunit alcohol dehydrogenase family)
VGLLDPILDRSVLFSFDRGGFLRHREGFRPEDLEVDLRGRSFLVTGSNSGLGRAAAQALAVLGAKVWMLCRSAERGRQARNEIRHATGNPKVYVETVDLADQGSIHRLAARFTDRPADVLIHNAGLLPAERQTTADGLELTFAVHVVGPLLLTRLLLPSLLRSPDARILQVSSGGMYGVRLDVDALLEPDEPYDGAKAYARTKRAQVVLNELLAERLADHGIACNAMHPGWAATPGVERSLPRFQRLLGKRLRTPEQGADTIVWLAACREAGFASGRFWFDRRQVPTHLVPWTRTRERPGERERLWETCCRSAGIEEQWEVEAPESRIVLSIR